MPLIDLHCDTAMKMYRNRLKGEEYHLLSNNGHIDLNKLTKGNYFLQCFAMFVVYNEGDPFETCMDMIDLFYEEINRNKDRISVVYSFDDIKRNLANNKLSALLTIEEGGVVKNKMSSLRNFYRLGVRMITLTWNFENGIGYPNIFMLDENKDFHKPNLEGGLTSFGIEMVREMERLGMIIDVSHLSDKGFYDVYNNTTKPFVASHSNARAVCPNVRNLTDDMIIKLNERGGVMGINYATSFIMENKDKTYVNDIVKHIKHIKEIASIDVISLGSDFDGINPNLEMKDASMLNMLIEELKKENFTDEEIDKITYKNAMRVFEMILK